jgi:hypothetical protein
MDGLMIDFSKFIMAPFNIFELISISDEYPFNNIKPQVSWISFQFLDKLLKIGHEIQIR